MERFLLRPLGVQGLKSVHRYASDKLPGFMLWLPNETEEAGFTESKWIEKEESGNLLHTLL